MTKIILFSLFLTVSSTMVLAQGNDQAPQLAGAGMVFSSSPYAGVEDRKQPVPILVGEYKNFYIKGLETGYHWFKSDTWRWSVLLSPRLMGYSSDDSTALNGMEDRKMSLDAGIQVKYALPGNVADIHAKVLVDMLSRYDGAAYELSLGKQLKGRIFRFSPSVGVRYLDRSLVDYYYGVEDHETRVGREAYAPDGAVDPFMDMVFMCGVSRNMVVVTRFGIESLAGEIRKSPLVDERYVFSGAVGIAYRF